MRHQSTAIVFCFLIGLITTGAAAAPILFDIDSAARDPGNGITVQDFIDAGVIEDLTGATAVTVESSTNSDMTGGGVTLGYVVNQANSDWGNDKYDNDLLDDYLAIKRGSNEGPVTMQIAGLADDLMPNTDYYLYLFGTGDNTNQNATFTFDGIVIETSGAAPGSSPSDRAGRFAKYAFTTGGVVDDALEFVWARTDDHEYAGLNGFAIVRVPEPATCVLMAAALCGLTRRRRVR